MGKEFENINKFAEDFRKSMNEMQPKLAESIKKMKEVTANLQPRLMKECKVNKKSAKVILYNDGAIRIEFAEKDYGEKFYKELK
jgi:hypothetical protein